MTDQRLADAASSPQLLNDIIICNNVLLVGIIYTCSSNHRVISYDQATCILHLIPDEEISFCLTHRSGLAKQFMKYMYFVAGQRFFKGYKHDQYKG